MPTIKEIKQLTDTGYVGTPIGCDAENVNLADGRTLEEFASSVDNNMNCGIRYNSETDYIQIYDAVNNIWIDVMRSGKDGNTAASSI